MAKPPAKYDPAKNSKTAIIMAYFADNPGASNIEASEALNAYGVDVKPSYIATIKSQQKKKAGGGKKKRKRTTKKSTRVAASSTATPLDTAVDLVQQAGSVEAARKTLDQLEQIAKLVK